MNFKDKVFLITGSTSGIGQGIAKALLEEQAAWLIKSPNIIAVKNVFFITINLKLEVNPYKLC